MHVPKIYFVLLPRQRAKSSKKNVLAVSRAADKGTRHAGVQVKAGDKCVSIKVSLDQFSTAALSYILLNKEQCAGDEASRREIFVESEGWKS